MIINNKNFLVLGLSKSGLASAGLIEKYGGSVCYSDDAVINENYKKIINLSQAPDIYCVIKSPGFKENQEIFLEITKENLPVISEIELGFCFCKAPVIAVTGTNGKTTTVTLLHKILSDFKLSSKLLGNIGTAFCETADELSYSDCVTLEVSSFQLDYTLNFKPHIAALLNITADHLDRHKTMENYINAKMKIFANMQNTEYAVLNDNCEITKKYKKLINANKYYFSNLNRAVRGCYVDGGDIVFKDIKEEYVCKLDDIKIPGQHNIDNTLCAVVSAKLMGVDNLSIQKSVREFMGVADRIEFVKTLNGVSFYNDSKGTNIDSTITAVKAMDKKTALILGGSDKGLDYRALFKNLSSNVAHCFICGQTTKEMVMAAQAENYTNYTVCENLNCAIVRAYNFLGNFGNVLLSPAAASFDSFKNYQERGLYFKKIVNQLVQ